MGFEDANRLLSGPRQPIARFDRIGDSITGTLVDAEIAPITDPKGEVQKDDNGRVKEQIIYTLQTTERDPEVEDDDGKRRVFAKWAIQKAISETLNEMGLVKVGLQEGGTITITHSETVPSKTRGYSDTKLYTVEYAPPPPRSLATSGESKTEKEAVQDPFQAVSEQQRELIATLNSQGSPAELIAAATKLPVEMVKAVIDDIAF